MDDLLGTSQPKERLEFSLAFPEAAHLAGLLNRVIKWDGFAVVRLQTRGQVVGMWASSPMGVLAFAAVPGQSLPVEPLDRVVYAARLRDIIGDLTQVEDKSVAISIRVPDAMTPSPELLNLPPGGTWLSNEKITCGLLSDVVEEAVKEFHARTVAYPNAAPSLLEQIAKDVWNVPSKAGMPLGGFHAARALGFLNHANAKAELSNNGTWHRLITPAGQIFFDNSSVKKSKLKLVT